MLGAFASRISSSLAQAWLVDPVPSLLVVVAAVAVLAALVALTASRTAGQASAASARVRFALAVRARRTGASRLGRQCDPDAAGRIRPRAPSAGPAA
jgi:uncharacterized protein DUF6412